MTMNTGKFAKAALILSILGLAVSLYLVVAHYTNTPVACPKSGIIDCAKVLNSQFANLLGVPLGAWGAAFFIIEMLVVLYAGRDANVLYNGIGVAFVAYLLFAEYSLRAICIYCTSVHILVIALFLLSIYAYERGAGRKPRESREGKASFQGFRKPNQGRSTRGSRRRQKRHK